MSESRPSETGRPSQGASGRPKSTESAAAASQAPETMEGWYVQHDLYTIDWGLWRAYEPEQRSEMLGELATWLQEAAAVEQGDSGAYVVSGQKAELMFIHYRQNPDELNQVRRKLMASRFSDVLIPAYGYLSIIEVSLYEATAIAHRNLAQAGIEAWQRRICPGP